jgi:hypothetical protein
VHSILISDFVASSPINVRLFQVDEALLCVQAAAETGQRAVAADTPMAWHNDGRWVSSAGCAQGPDGFGVANGFGDGFACHTLS